MTGFGRGKAESPDLRVQIDLRAVNHRFLDLRVRLPFFSPELEECLQKTVGAVLHRGKIDLALQIEEKGDLGTRLRVNRSLVKDYLETVRSLSAELDVPGTVSVDHISALPWGKVFEVQEMEVGEGLLPVFEEAAKQALEQLTSMREREGEHIRQDLEQHLRGLEELVDTVREGAGNLVELYRDKLEERIRALMQNREPDEEKLLQEAAFLADRSDISEELARLAGHIVAIRDTMNEDGPVGKKLDFLLQECHREVNTVGSKSKGADLSRQIVDAKARVEAMREQVQNVE